MEGVITDRKGALDSGAVGCGSLLCRRLPSPGSPWLEMWGAPPRIQKANSPRGPAKLPEQGVAEGWSQEWTKALAKESGQAGACLLPSRRAGSPAVFLVPYRTMYICAHVCLVNPDTGPGSPLGTRGGLDR